MKYSFIVTGSNGAIGIAICKRLAERGHQVIAVTRTPYEFVGLQDLGIRNEVLKSITDAVAVSQLFQKLQSEGIQVSGLVYGAAIFNRFENLNEISNERWHDILDVNVVGAFNWSRAFAAACVEDSIHGSIVNITSQAAFTGGFGGVIPYAASKGALISMTKGIAREFALKGVRANCVAPGFIETDSMRGTLNVAQLETFFNRVPMKRFGHVDEVASVVEFLLSAESSYLTGTTIDVTGGQLMH